MVLFFILALLRQANVVNLKNCGCCLFKDIVYDQVPASLGDDTSKYCTALDQKKGWSALFDVVNGASTGGFQTIGSFTMNDGPRERSPDFKHIKLKVCQRSHKPLPLCGTFNGATLSSSAVRVCSVVMEMDPLKIGDEEWILKISQQLLRSQINGSIYITTGKTLEASKAPENTSRSKLLWIYPGGFLFCPRPQICSSCVAATPWNETVQNNVTIFIWERWKHMWLYIQNTLCPLTMSWMSRLRVYEMHTVGSLLRCIFQVVGRAFDI